MKQKKGNKNDLPFYFAMPLRCFTPVTTPTGWKKSIFLAAVARRDNARVIQMNYIWFFNIFLWYFSYFLFSLVRTWFFFLLVHVNFYFTFNIIDLCVLFFVHSFTFRQSNRTFSSGNIFFRVSTQKDQLNINLYQVPLVLPLFLSIFLFRSCFDHFDYSAATEREKKTIQLQST